MATTVGRIEYIVGADGRVLTKESRDAARQAGNVGGKTYSDEMAKSFRKQWGSSSGFAAMLSKEDRRVMKVFQKTGTLASDEFRKRFEKNLVPAYQKVARKMINAFEGLQFDPLNGVYPELNRIFGRSEDIEREMRKVKGVLDEIDATSRMGILDRKSFDVGAVNKFRAALADVIDTENWELLNEYQRRSRDQLWEQAEALEAQEVSMRKRNELLGKNAGLSAEILKYTDKESEAALRRQVAEADALRDRNMYVELSDEEATNLIRQELQLDKIKAQNKAIHQQEIDRLDVLERHEDAIRRVWELSGREGSSGNFDKLRDEIREANAELDKVNLQYERMYRNSQQIGPVLAKPWQALDKDVRLVIAIIASAADQIAVLGSAAGAAGAAIGLGIGQGILSLYGAVSVFKALNVEVDQLPEALQQTGREYKAFGAAVKGTQTIIANSAILEMDEVFERLEDTVQALSPSLTRFGIAFGQLGDRMAKGLEPGTAAFEEIDDLITNSTDLLPAAGRAVGDFGTGILAVFNGATPLLEDFYEWLSRIGRQMQEFSNGPGLDEWVGNAQQVFRALGDVLDATGRALNDLVTPESVARTVATLDNLAEFIPVLGELLGVIGELDPLGVIVEYLAQMGQAISPLIPGLTLVASVLNDLLMAAGPLVPVLVSLAAVGKLFQGYNLAADAMSKFMTTLSPAQLGTATKGVKGLESALGKAGLYGAILTLATGAGTQIGNLIRDLTKIEEKAADVVASAGSIDEAYQVVLDSFNLMLDPIDDYGAAVDRIKEKNDNFFVGITSVWDLTARQADALAQAFTEMDAPFAKMADQSLPQAQAQFRAMTEEMGLTDQQIGYILEEMPQFSRSLESAAVGSDLVSASLGLTNAEMVAAAQHSRDTAQQLAEMEGKSGDAGLAIDGLAEKIRGFGNATLSTRDAERAFQAAIDDATESLNTNGTSLDVNTAAGRANEDALDTIAKRALEVAASTYEQTSSVEGATGAIQRGRDALIKQATQFGLTEDEANKYADELGLIPADVETIIDINSQEAINAANGVTNAVNGIPGYKQVEVNYRFTNTHYTPPPGTGPMALPGAARGMLLNGPRALIAGEAGPEAIVPLRRALSQVDPAVRALSAVAQGLPVPGGSTVPRMASGGVVGGGRSVMVSPGAIQINGSMDPRRDAHEVLNLLAERMTG